MTPLHHEERIQRWVKGTGLPVVSLEYGKAPEYPFPFAIDEVFDFYTLLVESKGRCLGMGGGGEGEEAEGVQVVLTGDSA